MRRIALAAFLVASLGALAAAPAAGARPRLATGFFGVVPQDALSAQDFDRMGGVVGTLRIPIFWPAVEPRAGQFELGGLDATVLGAAAAGVRVQPFVYGTPGWLAGDPARPPLKPAARQAWRRLLSRLVGRYGPGGKLWQGAPTPLPIRDWQIWNEPNFLLFWRPRPSPAGYARMLRTSARTIHAVDPGARILAAGLAPVEGGVLPWVFLRRLFGQPGVSQSVDLVALHPYSSSLHGMEFQIRMARRVLAGAGGGRLPLLVSELGVASASRLPTGFNWGLRGQATFLRRAYGMLIRERSRWRIAGVDWYAWRDLAAPDPHCVFCEHAGLFDRAGRAKPAWRALRSFAAGARP